jgi:hypothetical protein
MWRSWELGVGSWALGVGRWERGTGGLGANEIKGNTVPISTINYQLTPNSQLPSTLHPHIRLLMQTRVDLSRSEDAVFFELFVPVCQPTGYPCDRKYRRK